MVAPVGAARRRWDRTRPTGQPIRFTPSDLRFYFPGVSTVPVLCPQLTHRFSRRPSLTVSGEPLRSKVNRRRVDVPPAPSVRCGWVCCPVAVMRQHGTSPGAGPARCARTGTHATRMALPPTASASYCERVGPDHEHGPDRATARSDRTARRTTAPAERLDVSGPLTTGGRRRPREGRRQQRAHRTDPAPGRRRGPRPVLLRALRACSGSTSAAPTPRRCSARPPRPPARRRARPRRRRGTRRATPASPAST